MKTTFAELLKEVKAALPMEDAPKPFAFFDADHTLWAGDIGDDAFCQALEAGAFKQEAARPLGAFVEAAGAEATDDPHENARRLYSLYGEERVDDESMIRAMVICYAGWSVEQLRDFGAEVAKRSFEAKVYEGLHTFVDGLRAIGVNVRVISGSPQHLLEGALKVFDVSADAIFGARTAVTDESMICGEIVGPVTYKEGKVAAMHTFIGDGPILLGFGDSAGDIPMLDRASIRVGMNPRPALQSHAMANPDRWRFIFPERTIDGTAVLPLTGDRLIQ